MRRCANLFARARQESDRLKGAMMRTRLLAFGLAAITGGLFLVVALFGSVAAQTDKLVWDKDVATVKRVAKPGRKPAPRRQAVIQAPLLTIQYRLIKRLAGGQF